MGYTHYWRREQEIAAEKFNAIVEDFGRLVLALHDAGVDIAGPMGTDAPTISADVMAFNGRENCGHAANSEVSIPWPTVDAGGVGRSDKAVDGRWYAGASLDTRCCNGDCSYEDFTMHRVFECGYEQTPDNGLFFACCKTAFRPYDIAVTACLIVAKQHLSENIVVSSDGEDQHWFDAKMLCQTVLGYGLEFEIQESVLVNTARPDGGRTWKAPVKFVDTRPVRDYSYVETAKEIRSALKTAFPKTKFSVTSKSYSGGCSISARWTDGPTGKQVSAILDRFNGRGFDGMTDCSYYCGERNYKGERVNFNSGYVNGSRSLSRELVSTVADRLAYECGLGKQAMDQYGNVGDRNQMVPFAWHDHYMRCGNDNNKQYLTMADIEGAGHILASDSHRGEYFTTLVDRIAQWTSLEEAKPVQLPEYIDLKALASTGRASFEAQHPKFAGHTDYTEGR